MAAKWKVLKTLLVAPRGFLDKISRDEKREWKGECPLNSENHVNKTPFYLLENLSYL